MASSTGYKTTIRGNVVRFWNVFSQQWMVMDAADLWCASKLMATFSERDRRRVQRAANADLRVVVSSPADGVISKVRFYDETKARDCYDKIKLGSCQRVQLLRGPDILDSRGYVGVARSMAGDGHPSFAL